MPKFSDLIKCNREIEIFYLKSFKFLNNYTILKKTLFHDYFERNLKIWQTINLQKNV